MEIIATGGDVWDISSGDIVETLRDHTRRISSVCFSPCGTLLASGPFDRSIILWNCQTWTKLQTLQTFIGHTQQIRYVSFNRTSDRIVSTSNDGTACVWSVGATDMDVLTIHTEASSARAASFNDSGDTIAVACDCLVNLYDAHSGELKQSLVGHEDHVSTVQYSQDGCVIVSGAYNHVLIIWDAASGSIKQELRGHKDAALTEVCFNADASRIVSSSYDHKARIWDVYTGECLLTLCGHQLQVMSCCFSEDGSKVITGSMDGTVKVWDSYTGEELRTLSGHEGYVRSVSYRPSIAGSYI